MAHAGVVVTVTRQGDPDIIRGLVREVDRKARAVSGKARSGATSDAADTPEVAALRTVDCSEKLLRRLAAHRTAALQVVLSRNPQVALATLTHAFALRVFG